MAFLSSRYTVCVAVFFLTVVFALSAVSSAPAALWSSSLGWWIIVPLVLLSVLGVYDLFQTGHSLLRNYPLLGHLRWVFEGVRPEIRQYLIESDADAVPFSREQRSLVYRRAKGVLDTRPFGTQLDVYEPGYDWLVHSMAPLPVNAADFRITIGGPECTRRYDASIFNISAMSFGSLSANAIAALNKGASMGNFAHDTGEGSISPYHREHGGDLIWEIASGYFGCRDGDGNFDPDKFAAQAAADQVKMIEIKLSQGAKPGHGGVLPGAKVTPEIASTRGIPVGVTCVSPAAHSAFSTPLELVAFIARLRELSGGKPVGFKLCIGAHWQFMAIIKAILETDICPDFIVIDGTEGGTGAAPLEFANHVGEPMAEGLMFVDNALRGAGLRDRIKLGAAGKITSAFHIARAIALGADWCNAARGFMFAIGCIQAQSCHNNECPVGVATQDPLRQRALVVPDKAKRVATYHRNTLHVLAELVAAAGLRHPSEITPWHIRLRSGSTQVETAYAAYDRLEPGQLLTGGGSPAYATAWSWARADTFDRVIG